MWNSLPLFGTALILMAMVAASYTFAVALSAGSSGRPRALQSARLGAYGTIGLVATAVLCLAYAFVSHDYRLRYVAHYSDRSMSTAYLLTALWGGQDGSLLWWLFLLCLYVGVCVHWLGKRYLELQPYVIATLMAVIVFFCVLMAFAANPFATSLAGTKADGEGLNPLLQNFYMIIHPPSLYVGFVGCTIPFAFAIAALVTGRLDHEWIVASRRWTLFSWMFLGIGNTLGMLWAYEELGWGGYWAWDPVENAAFMPFLTASAFIHSVMIQERRGLFKVWNIALVCTTFLMTIFGTFLTRSGAIASVHSFAQSSIGEYFVGFLLVAAALTSTLIFYRWPELKNMTPTPALRRAAVVTGWFMIAIFGPGLYSIYQLPVPLGVRLIAMALAAGAGVFAGLELVFRRLAGGVARGGRKLEIESFASREFTFMLNNWALLSFMVFVLVATTFPMMSEALWNEKVTVGPPYYNAWVQPLGLIIFALMGLGSLFGWKKTTGTSLRRALVWPVGVGVGTATIHMLAGQAVGFPAVVWSDAIYPGSLGQALRGFNAITPVLGVSLCAFNTAVIVQEFAFLFAARSKSATASKTPAFLWYFLLLPGFLFTLVTLPPPSRRRYGGYIVHFGIVLMFLGFTGKSWTVDRETTMAPHQVYHVENYSLEYVGPRMEVDNNKRMVFADILVSQNGVTRGTLSPAKFIYKKMPESPTTEVAMMHSLRDDLYLVVGTVNPQTKLASLQIHINPLVGWIWFGCLVLILGSAICMWPELEPKESRVWAVARTGAAVAASVTLGIMIALTPARAYADGTSSLHAGTVRIENLAEREVFSSLRCMCGTCARDLLSTCACGTAEASREEIRAKLKAGMSKDMIVAEYAHDYGTESLSIPPNTGAMRAIYALPLVAIAIAGMGLGLLMYRSKQVHLEAKAQRSHASKADIEPRLPDDYDRRLDDELKNLDD